MRKAILHHLTTLSHSKHIYWILFALALGTRIVGAYMGGTRNDGDGTHLSVARNMLNGLGICTIITDIGPLYTWFLPGEAVFRYTFLVLFDSTWLAPKIFYVIYSSVTIVLFFVLCQKIFDKKFALLATLIWIFYVPHWFWSTRITAQTYAMNGYVITLLLLFIAWERKSKVLPLVIGVFWASMTYMRGEAIFGVFVFALASLWAFPNKKQGLTCGALLVLGWVLGMSPWWVRNYRIQGEFILTANYSSYLVWTAYNKDFKFTGFATPWPDEMRARLAKEKDELKRKAIFMEETRKNIRENPYLIPRTIFGNMFHYIRPWLSPKVVSPFENIVYVSSYLPIFILMLMAIPKIPWRNPLWMAIIGLFVYKSLIHLPFYFVIRFREAIIPYYIMVAMLSVIALLEPKSKLLKRV